MIRGVYGEENIHPLVFALVGMAVALISRAKQEASATKPALVAAPPLASGLGRKLGVKPPSEKTNKPMGFGMVVVVMLACAVVYYLACFAWRLAH